MQSTSQYSTVWWSDGKLAVLCSRPVSTAQCGGQMESLWYCSYGGSRGLELDMETSGAFWIWISVPGTWSVHTGLAAFGVWLVISGLSCLKPLCCKCTNPKSCTNMKSYTNLKSSTDLKSNEQTSLSGFEKYDYE